MPKILETLADQGYVEKINGSAFFKQATGRDAVVFNIDGAIIPVYRSSQGTSSKTKGEWYPFFFNGGDWLVKAGADSYKDGYNNPIIKQILDALNKNYTYDKPLAKVEGNNEELLSLLPLGGLDLDVSIEDNRGIYDFQNYIAIAVILKDWQSKLGNIDVSGYQDYLDRASSSLIKTNPTLKSEIEKAFKIPSDIFAELADIEKTTKIQPAKKTSKEVLETDIEITEEAQLNSDVGEVRNEQSEVGAKLVEPANFEKLQPFKELLEDGSNKVGLKVEFVISEDDSDYTKESVKSQVAFNKNEGDPDSNKRIDYLTNNAAIRVYFLNSKGERLKDKNGQEIFTFLYKPEGASSEAVGNRERKIRQVIVKTLLANKQAFGKVQGQYPYMFNNTSPVQENRLDDISAFGATSEEIRNNIVFASNGLTKEGEMSSFGAGWMNYKGVRSIDVPSKKFETSEDVRRFAGRVGIKIKNINGKTSVAKLNVKKLTEEDANFVFDLYKYGVSKNQKSLDIKLDRDQEGIDLIEKFKSIVGDSIKPPATVREMIAFFVHEAGYKRDGRKQWNRQTQIRLFQGGLKFGETFKDGNQLNEKETRRQVVEFLMTKKRYNILKDKMSDIKYVEWLIENKILNTDLDIENPLTSSKTFSGAMFIKSDDIELTESVKSREIKPNSKQDKTLRFLNNLLKLQISDNKYVIRNKEGEIVKSFTRVSDFIKGAPSDINNFTAVEIGNAVDAVARDYFAGKDMTNWQKYKDPSNNKQYFESKEVFDSLIDQMRPLMQMIKDNGGVAFTEEITLFDSEKGVAGTPDMMVVWPSGKISIVDFKAFKKGKARLEEKQNGESVLDFYTKQQNVYRILAKNMGFNVAAVNLMVFHVNYEEEKYVVTGTGNDFGLTEQLKRTNDVNGLVLKNQEEDKTPSRQDNVLTKKFIEQEGPAEKSPEEVDKKPTEPTQPSNLGEAPSEDQMSEMPKGLFSKKGEDTKQKEEDVVEEEKVYFFGVNADKTAPVTDLEGKPMKKEKAIFEITYNPVTGEGRVDIINPNNKKFEGSFQRIFENSVEVIGETPQSGRPFKGGVQIKPGVAKKIDGKWVITTPVQFEFLYDDDGPRISNLDVTLAYKNAKKNYPETQESLEDLLILINTLDEKTSFSKSKKKGLMQYADELKEKLKNKPETPSTDQTRKEEAVQEDSESQDMINDILNVAETGELLDDDTPNNGQSTDSEEADNTCD